MLLQQRSIDVEQRMALVQDVQGQLKELREELDDWNKIWFQLAVEMYGIPITQCNYSLLKREACGLYSCDMRFTLIV